MIFKANENNELTLFGKTIKEIQTGMDKIRNGQMMGQGNASTGLTAFVQSLKGVNDEIAQLKILTKDEAASYFSKFIEASKSGKQVTADFLDDLEVTDKTMAGYLRTVEDGEPVFQDYQKYCDNLVASNKQVAASSKVAALGMKALAMAGNMLLMWGITKIIGEIAESIEEYTHRIENAKESISDLSSEMKDLKATLDDTQKTVGDVSKRFAELYQGIDSNTGKNRSLNTEEYEEFLELNNQLAELFPSLSRTYNENGEAILQLSGDVDTIVGSLNALVEAQRELTNQEIADKLPELYESFQTVNNDKKSGYQKQIEDLDKQTERYKKYLNQLRELSSWDDLNNENGVSDEYTDLLTQMYIDTDDLGEHFSKKSIDSVIKYYEDELKDLNAELVKVTNEQKSSWGTLLQSLFAEVGNDETYKLLSDQAQAGVQDIINALDFSELSKKYKTSDALVGFISDNIINPISSNQELKDAFAELYSLEPGDLDRVEIAKEIQSILDGMDLEVPIDIMPIVSEEQDAQTRLKNSFADVVGNSTTATNYGDYKRMEAEYKLLEEYTKDFTQAEVEAWLEATDGAESATEMIRMYEDATADAAKEMEKLFTEDQIKRLDEYQSKLSSLADSYSKLLSGNYSRSDVLDILKSLSEKGFDISHVDSINSLQGLIKYSTIATDDLDALIKELGIAPDSDLADFLRDMTYETLRVDPAFEGLSTRLGELKSGYTTLKDAIDEYNKSGKLTTETFDALMNMDYDNLFSVLGNGKIEIDKEGIRKELLDYIAYVKTTLIDENTNSDLSDEAKEDYQTKKKLLDEFEEYVRSSDFNLNDIFGIESDFDKFLKDFDNKISRYENEAKYIEAQLANAEARGYIANEAYYEALENVEQNNYDLLEDKLSKLNELMKDSGLKENSDEWHELQNEIEETTIALQESKNKLLEFYNQSRQIKWDIFDFSRDRESKFMDEADFLIDLMDRADKFNDEMNSANVLDNLTKEGLATMGLRAANYNAYLEQSIEYSKELAKTQDDIANNKGDTELLNRYDDLLEKQQEAILSAEAEKDAMIDLVSEGIEAQKEAFQDLINEYTEALDVQKNLYDYQKKNSEQTKKIAQIQKQLAAYSGDQSEEARAKVQQLKVQLDEEQDALESDQYDRYISDQKEILTSIQEDYETALDAYLDNTTKVITDSINAVNQKTSEINNTVSGVAEDVGYELSVEMDSIFGKNGVKLKENFDGVAKNVADTNSILSPYIESTSKIFAAMSSKINNIDVTLLDISGKLDNIGNTSVEFKTKKSSYDKSKLNTDSSVVDLLEYNDFNSSKTARADYYRQMGFTDVYTGSEIQNNAMLEWLKKNGYGAKEYASGGFNLKKQLAWTQENGELEYIIRPSDGAILTPVPQNGMVLNAEASKRLWEVSNNPMQFIKDNMSTSIPNAPFNNGNNNVENNIQMTITLPGVSNYQEFVTRLQSDAKFEKMIVDVTSSALTGNNSLSKYRHRF